MAREFVLGSIKALGEGPTMRAAGRIVGLRIVGDGWTGTLTFQSRNGADEWATQTLKSLDGSETYVSTATAAGDFRGSVPRLDFRCVATAWTGGVAYVHVVVEEPGIEAVNERPILLTLGTDVDGAYTSDPVHLDHACDTHVCSFLVTSGTIDLDTSDIEVQGSSDGQHWTRIVAVAVEGITPAPVVNGVYINLTGQILPAVTWVRLKAVTLGGTSPVVTFKYCGVAAP